MLNRAKGLRCLQLPTWSETRRERGPESAATEPRGPQHLRKLCAERSESVTCFMPHSAKVSHVASEDLSCCHVAGRFGKGVKATRSPGPITATISPSDSSVDAGRIGDAESFVFAALPNMSSIIVSCAVLPAFRCTCPPPNHVSNTGQCNQQHRCLRRRCCSDIVTCSLLISCAFTQHNRAFPPRRGADAQRNLWSAPLSVSTLKLLCVCGLADALPSLNSSGTHLPAADQEASKDCAAIHIPSPHFVATKLLQQRGAFWFRSLCVRRPMEEGSPGRSGYIYIWLHGHAASWSHCPCEIDVAVDIRRDQHARIPSHRLIQQAGSSRS